jgi:hypothetical protein
LIIGQENNFPEAGVIDIPPIHLLADKNLSRLFEKFWQSFWVMGGGPLVSIPLDRRVSIRSLT